MSAATTFSLECHQTDLLARMQSDGAYGVVDLIQSFDSNEQRRQLYSLSQRTFGQANWPGKNFDAYIEVVEAGIAEGLRHSDAASEEEAAAQCKDFEIGRASCRERV